MVSAVSNYPMASQCIDQLSNGRTVLCPTVQRSDSAVSNTQTVQWLDIAVSNSPKVCAYCRVAWDLNLVLLDSKLFSAPLIIVC